MTLLTFGCTTVRAPVSAIDPTVPIHGGTAEPQVELWLESAADPTPAESARAVADAREALRQALQGRTLGYDEVLVVRAQAVSRTQSHRSDQHAVIAGIVVGALAIVVLAVIASRGHGGGAPMRLAGGHAARAASGGFRPAALPNGIPAFRPGAGPPRQPGAVPVVPRPHGGRPSSAGGAGMNVDVAFEGESPQASEPEPWVEAFAVEAPLAGEGAVPFQPVPTERIVAVTLTTPPPLTPSQRGFFDGDSLQLELLVVDAWTGAVRWAKRVTEDVDVRDAGEVRRVIDAALASPEGWTMAGAVAP
jgi:hypothetical protein